jgi:hypothetical protein
MKKRVFITASALALATGVAIILWNLRNDSNLASDQPPFNSITLPLRGIRGNIHMDGGSVWVGVKDRKGVLYDFIFPYDNKTEGYPTAFYGAMTPHAPGAVPLANPSRARAIVLTWLRQAGGHDEDLDITLDCLSGSNRSILRRVQRDGIRGIFR